MTCNDADGARCLHQLRSHPQLRKGVAAVLAARSASHSGCSRSKSRGASITSTEMSRVTDGEASADDWANMIRRLDEAGHRPCGLREQSVAAGDLDEPAAPAHVS